MKHHQTTFDHEAESDLDIEAGELNISRHDLPQTGESSLREPPPTDMILEQEALPAVRTSSRLTGPPSSTPAMKSGSTNRTPIAWRDLPRKQQLVVITLARMSEPLVQTSLQSYMFYQLKWFDPSLPDSTISTQAGILHASFMAAQFVTAMLWGRAADSVLMGRKKVILVGLLGTSVSCLGFGFSTSFWQALLFRTFGGATNGNIGVMRTMISEIIREKRFQSRAFLLLPMTFNIGVIIGPILGGVLSDPAGSYPDRFGKMPFFIKFPYATPNIVSSLFLATAALAVWLGLEETHETLREMPSDVGITLGHKLAGLCRRLRSSSVQSGRGDYTSLPSTDVEMTTTSATPAAAAALPRRQHEAKKQSISKRYTQRLPFRRIFTRNVIMTLIAHFFFTFHIGTFNSLWFVFLSTPVFDPHGKAASSSPRLPFHFTGGVGLQPRSVGVAMAILGIVGLSMQLFLYPSLSARLGTIRSWRTFLLCFPVTYLLVPYLSIVPSTSDPPSAKTGPWIWMAIVALLFIQVTGRTFALPSQTILVNNCSPHPSVLGTVHGIGQSVSSAARTIGPVVGGVVYGFGLNHGVVGTVFWCLCCVAICNCLASLLVKEGDGHEIWLEGDVEEDL